MPTSSSVAPLAEGALPAGTRFGELEVLRVLGAGGFGVVYLAHDHALDRQVALKEYLPRALAGRAEGARISLHSGSDAPTYAAGLRSFVNEAQLLARFDHPSLVKVYRFWEENGTAYMVMPYLEGPTLREVRSTMSTAPGQAWILGVTRSLVAALERLHREAVFHRDIAPDNILLPAAGRPVLLDFGAARRAIGDRTQAFTAILKPSYAPIEQYADAGAMRQGPWTDFYALGAVVHYLLKGVPPAPATARALQDEGPIAWGELPPDVTPAFLAAVDWMLAIRPADRPQSAEELLAVLDGRAPPPLPGPRGHEDIFDPTLPAGAPPAGATTSGFEPTRVDRGGWNAPGPLPEAPARRNVRLLVLAALLLLVALVGLVLLAAR